MVTLEENYMRHYSNINSVELSMLKILLLSYILFAMVVITIELETTTENIREKLKRSCSDCIQKQSQCKKKCREDCKGKIKCNSECPTVCHFTSSCPIVFSFFCRKIRC